MPRRYFGHGELPLVLLALLDQQPRHGYDVMSELNRLFAPAYSPSPGTVYPALDALASEGLIVGDTNGDRTVWRPTRTGRRALADRADMLAALEVRTGVRLGEDQSLGPVLARFTARLMPLSHRIDPQTVADVLDDAATQIENALTHTPARKSRQ
jgi:DNA-binding PadR family transcriptional regulator